MIMPNLTCTRYSDNCRRYRTEYLQYEYTTGYECGGWCMYAQGSWVRYCSQNTPPSTPVYCGTCDSNYPISCQESREVCDEYEVECTGSYYASVPSSFRGTETLYVGSGVEIQSCSGCSSYSSNSFSARSGATSVTLSLVTTNPTSCGCYASGSVTIYKEKNNQSISIGISSDLVVGNSYSINANASCGGSLSYSCSPSDGVTISGGTIRFSKPGVYILSVTAGETSNCKSVTRTKQLNVLKKDYGLIYTGPTNFIVGDQLSLSAKTNVGLTNFTFSSDYQEVVILGNNCLIQKFGLFSITVYCAGDSQYREKSIDVTLICSIDNLNPVLFEISSGGVNSFI